MAYTKTPIGNVTKGARHPRGDKALQFIADTCDENFADIETAFGLDTVLGFGTEPGAVSSSTSGQSGTAATASRSDHNHDLGAHAHAGAASGGTIAYSDIASKPTTFAPVVGSGAADAAAGNHAHSGVYQPVFSGSTTLTQLGIVPPSGPAWAGTAMAALTGASTFQQLLGAISTDIATAATLPSS